MLATAHLLDERSADDARAVGQRALVRDVRTRVVASVARRDTRVQRRAPPGGELAVCDDMRQDVLIDRPEGVQGVEEGTVFSSGVLGFPPTCGVTGEGVATRRALHLV